MDLEWCCGHCDIPPTCTYLICTSPRTGSWLLADGLADTKLAGHPSEWLNILKEKDLKEEHHCPADMPYPEYLKLACSLSHTPNGVSGLKVMFYQATATLANRMGTDTGTAFREVFPDAKYLYLARNDIVRQSISYVLAAKRDVWWDHGDAPDVSDPEYDAADITDVKHRLARQDANWGAFFTQYGITPLVVSYEDDLLTDYPGTIRRVLRWLHQDATVDIPPPRLRQQSNQVNEEWLERYLKESSCYTD